MQLFDRTNNRILLNTQGEIFLKHTNRVFSCLEDAKEELAQSLMQQVPNISIAGVNNTMWVNLFTAFTSEYPQYTLSCASMPLQRLASEGLPAQYSFLLAYESEIPPSYMEALDCAFLFHAYPTVMLHKDHPLAQEAEIDIRMLSGERIFMPYSGSSMHTRLEQLYEYYQLPFPTENANSYLVRRKMVSQNLGVSFFNMYAGYVPSPHIRCIPLVDPYGPWNTCLYWRKDHPLTKYESDFKTFTVDFFQDLH